jgi:hypothetical protein
MTTFIDAETITNLTNYDGLLLAVAKWLERDDLTDQIPDFIRLAEARFRRVIRNPEREVSLTIGLDGSTPLPADFDSARLLTAPGLRPGPNIDQVTPAVLSSYTRYPGNPSVFAIVAGQILLSPVPSVDLAATLVYNASIPRLSLANQSNWLLLDHPDIYLFATLIQAEFYGWNDDRLGLMKAAVDEGLAELSEQGQRRRYGPGPLIARPAVYEAVRGAYRR